MKMGFEVLAVLRSISFHREVLLKRRKGICET